MESNVVLSVEGLKTYLFTKRGIIKAVDGVSFSIKRSEIFGLVGESGSGKTMTALSILRLVDDLPARIVGGKILLDGIDILACSEKEMSKIRGKKIGMVFQDPLTSLNPVLKIRQQLIETIMYHNREISKLEARQKALELLKDMGITDIEVRLEQYPFQLSGGMRQRVMLALALAANPSILVADEPTTNLDVTIQAQILNLIKYIREAYGMAVMLITHNLGIVAWVCDRVAVMYAGKIVEYGDTLSIFDNPLHPYTQLLIKSITRLENYEWNSTLIGWESTDYVKLPSGCRFHPRCPYAMESCKNLEPQLIEIEKGHYVSCFIYENDGQTKNEQR